MSKKILLIGPKTSVSHNLIGGATISFGYLEDYFLRNSEDIRVINTKHYFGSLSSVFNAARVVFKLLLNIWWADVVFLNSSRGGTKLLAPVIFIFTKIFRAKFVFRPFGGDINVYTQDYGYISKKIFKQIVLKADILYLQTKALIKFYGKGSQLTTSRKRPEFVRTGSYNKKFIYLGFLNSAKGIEQLLEVREKLDSDYTIHIYGPIKEDKFKSLADNIYKGVLKKEEVLKKLVEYDVLILPTFYEGEGYPGVIIEAYSLGLPVITTRWKAIPEIVEERATGILVNPGSSSELLDAIKSINKAEYHSMSAKALQYFNDTFDEERVLGRVRKEINQL